jgi:plastocyanin
MGHSGPRRGRRALPAAAAALAACVAIAVAGVAGVAQGQAAPATIYVSDANGLCFTTVARKPACAPGEHPEVTIRTGEAVTWDFVGTTQPHNAESKNAVAADPAWEGWGITFPATGTHSRRFDTAGVYEFVCLAHAAMTGTIRVEGEGTATPTPTSTPTQTATATPTPLPTASPAPTPDDHTSTPKPTGGPKDEVAPQVGGVSTTALKRALRVRFTVSENATVAITARRAGTSNVLTSATVQAPAGTRTYTLRSSRLSANGTYTVELRATDAAGNRSGAATASLKARR